MPDGLIAATEAHVRQLLAGDSAGHDWWHIQRVRQLAVQIGRAEGVDLAVVELAALLHDVADWKYAGGDEQAGARTAHAWLEGQGAAPGVADHVATIIGELSFKGAGVATPMSTREGAVVQDADRLDAIGAVGIARAFAFGGARNRLMHDPDQPPQLHQSFAAYKASTGTTINHFHEKLLLLKERLNTAAARTVAAERHAFMELFLARFAAEWRGEA